MKFIGFGAAASLALMLASTHVLAATVIFDDFTIAQYATDQPGMDETSSNFVAFGLGTRTLTAENVTFNGNPRSSTVMEVFDGSLSFSNKDRATGRGTVTYTNVGDISRSSNPFFFFDVGEFDRDANFVATAEDTDGNVGMYTELLTIGFDPKLFFSQFSGSVDFNSIAKLSFSIDSIGMQNGVDGSLRSISISMIPLPAGGLLLLSGLGLMAVVRRKRKA